MRKSRGFTLVEVMIVVGVLGILTTLAMPTYNSYLLRVKVSETFTLLQYNHRQFITENLFIAKDGEVNPYTNSVGDTKSFIPTSFDTKGWSGNLESASSTSAVSPTNYAASEIYLMTNSFLGLPQSETASMSFMVVAIVDENMIIKTDDSPASMLPGFKRIYVNDSKYFEPKNLRWICGFSDYDLRITARYMSVKKIMEHAPRDCRNIISISSYMP